MRKQCIKCKQNILKADARKVANHVVVVLWEVNFSGATMEDQRQRNIFEMLKVNDCQPEC